MKVVLALGANLGDRESTIDQAIIEINEILEVTHLSSLLESEAVGGPEQPDYLNAIAIGHTELEPNDLMRQLLDIEARLGRVRTERWGARTIDIDIISMGDLIMKSEQVELPHPRAHERRFVLAPWIEIDPEGQIPGKGRIENLLSELDRSE